MKRPIASKHDHLPSPFPAMRRTPRICFRSISAFVQTAALPAAVIWFSGSAPTSFAANIWDGGGVNTNWSTGANWDDNNTATSGSGNDVHLAGTTGLNSFNDYGGFTAWRNILFDVGAGSFNLTSAVGANWDLYFKIENNSINAQSITIDAIALQSASNANEFDATSGNLTITAKDIYNNGKNLTFFGTQTLTVNNGGGSGIQGAGKVILGSSFTGTAILTGSNAYTGNTEINSGILKAGNNSALGTSTVFVGNGGATGTAATLLLTGSGISIGNNLNTNAGTNSNRTIGGDNTTGTNTFTGSLTMASGGSATLTAASGGTVAFKGVISGTGQGITKTGLGTVTLSGANTYTGATTVSVGTLKLDFSAAGAPTTNIISSSSLLTLGGGSLQVAGASASSIETVNGLTLISGLGSITTSNSATLVLGAISTPPIGATLRFQGPATINNAGNVAATGTITTTTAGASTSGGNLGSFRTNTGGAGAAGGYATVGLYDFASTNLAGAGGVGTSPYTIIGGSQVTGFYVTTTPSSSTSVGNFDVTAAGTTTIGSGGEKSMSTVRFNTSTATTLNLTALASGTQTLLTGNAFLVTPNMGANNVTVQSNNTGLAVQPVWQIARITTPTGTQEGVIWQNNTLGFMNFNAIISDGRDSGDTNVITKAGAGTLLLGGTNTYTGQTFLNEGTTMITANANLGAIATGAALNLNSGSLVANATFSLDNAGANLRTVNLNGAGGGLSASTGNTFTVAGLVAGSGSLTVGSSTLAGSGAGTANTTAITGDGTVVLTGGNTYSGGTVLKGGTLRINGINALGGANYGGLTLNGGTLLYAPAFSGNGSGDLTSIGTAGVTLASGGGTIDVNGNTVTLAGSVGNGGSGALTVKTTASNGVLGLQGANTYSGGTTVNSGTTLKVNNTTGSATGSGAVTIATGATLGGTGTISGIVTNNGTIAAGNSVGTLTLGSLTMNASSIYNFEFNATPANDRIVVTTSNGLVLNGGGFNIYLEGGTTGFTTPNTYNLIQYSGSISGTGTGGGLLDSTWTTASASNAHVLNAQTGFIYAFGTSGGFITLTIAAGQPIFTWNSAASGTWSTTANWTSPTSSTLPPNQATAAVTFGTVSGAPSALTVTLDQNATVGGLTFAASGTSYTIAQGGSNTITLDNGGGGASIVGSANNNTIAANLSLKENTTMSVTGSGSTLTISGPIANGTGTRTITKTGNGTLVLTNANSYGPSAGTTGTILSAGTLQVGNNSALGAGDLSVASTSTLQSGAAGLNLANNIVISSGANSTVDTQANTLTLSGTISGSGTLTKNGVGTLLLSVANSYGPSAGSVGTTLAAGTIGVGNNSALSTGDLSVSGNSTLQATAAGLSLANNVTLAGGTTGTFDTNGNDLTLSGVITGASGSFTKIGAGILTLSGSGNSFSTAVGTALNINGGTLQAGAATAIPTGVLLSLGGGTLDLNANAGTAGSLSGASGTITDNSAGAGTTLLTVNQTTTTTYAGAINDGSAKKLSLTKSGAGTLNLTGTSTTTGNLTANGGVLAIGAGSYGAAAANIVSGQLVINGGILTASASSNITTGSSGLLVSSGTANFNGGLTTDPGTNNGNLISVPGGNLNAASLFLGRTALNLNSGAQPTAGSTTAGLYINGGAVHITGALNMGTTTTANSSANARMDSGSLTVDGTTVVTINNGGRWSALDINGGIFTSNDTTGAGIRIGGNFAAAEAILLVRAGTANVNKITFGDGTQTSGNDVLSVTGGSLYVGSGGIVSGGAGAFTSTISLGTATVGALADWSSSMAMGVTGTTTFQAADASSTAHNITLSGAVSGAGSLNKTGGGTLSLSGTNSVTSLLARSGTTVIAGSTTVTSFASVGVGNGDSGTLTVQTGGSLTATAGAGDLNVGDNAGSTGVLNVTGGSVTALKLSVGKNFDLGAATATGTVNQSSGILTVNNASGVVLANNPNSVGTYNLDGGILLTQKVSMGTGTSGVFNFNGGTLKAGAGNATFMSGLTSANVRAGGAVIDTNSNDVTIGQALLNGVVSDGGLTKQGNGTLTITGNNTFNGTTTVSAGTLSLNSAGTNTAIPTDANTATTSDIVINGGALRIAASEQIGDSGSITMTSGSLGFTGSGRTETIDKLTVSGGTFNTGANTLLVGGATVTWAGGTNTIATNGLVSDKHWVITGGTNTVQQTGLLRVQSGTGTVGLFFGGTSSPTITLDSDGTNPGEILLRQNVTVDSTLTSGTAQILSGGSASLPGAIDLDGGTRTFSVNNGSAATDLLISASIQSSGAIIKADTGTLTLTGANTFTGSTTINAGTLEAGAASALGFTVSVVVNAGGTLLLGGSGDRVNDSTTTFTLAGGKLDSGGLSETFGALTLTDDSIIDFGGGASTLTFADSTNLWTANKTLSIWNWSGTPIDGGGTDQLRFTSNGLNSTQLAHINFYSDSGVTQISITPAFSANGFVGSYGEVVPVPEPSSVATVMGLLGLVGWRERRKSGQRRRETRLAVAS